ncbi:hypothetical protein GGX14DRAFT_11783 [Mycena pura]|uniref:Uncharacterized protein n=1 Tax=Mycena pura TaxID=153505 RepID=A0AAD6UTD8_9AGAR|nr:hypothetical protein GGX14DRAFT_11783 [Mycena pura]
MHVVQNIFRDRSPAQGAMFSIISLNVPNKTVVVPLQASGSGLATAQPSPSVHKKNIGGAVAPVVVVMLLAATGYFFHRRWKQRNHLAPRAFRAPLSIGESQSLTLPANGDPRRSTPTPYTQQLPDSDAEFLRLQAPEPILTSQQLLLQPPLTSGAPPLNGTTHLWTEVENLRREMALLRMSRQATEELPMYQSVIHDGS